MDYLEKAALASLERCRYEHVIQSSLYLLGAGADPGAHNDGGVTPLMKAAATPEPLGAELIAGLLKVATDVDAADNSGLTALNHAVNAGKPPLPWLHQP